MDAKQVKHGEANFARIWVCMWEGNESKGLRTRVLRSLFFVRFRNTNAFYWADSPAAQRMY